MTCQLSAVHEAPVAARALRAARIGVDDRSAGRPHQPVHFLVLRGPLGRELALLLAEIRRRVGTVIALLAVVAICLASMGACVLDLQQSWTQVIMIVHQRLPLDPQAPVGALRTRAPVLSPLQARRSCLRSATSATGKVTI